MLQVFTYKQSTLTWQKVQPMHHSSIRGVEDMSTLEDLHDGAIMHNLFLRYQHRHVYVSVAQLQTKLQLETKQNLPGAIGPPGAQSRCWGRREVLLTGIQSQEAWLGSWKQEDHVGFGTKPPAV